MNRKIKFRAWDKENKQMILPKDDFWENSFKDMNGSLYVKDEFWPWKEIYFLNGAQELQKKYSDCLEVMQFTGLKDKNDIEMYEDDLFKLNNKVFRIVFKNGCFYGEHKEPDGIFLLGILNKIEIIGNVWENPDLLEAKNESY